MISRSPTRRWWLPCLMTDDTSLNLRDRRDRRLSFIAAISITVGLAFLAVSVFFPGALRPRAVVAGSIASVPTVLPATTVLPGTVTVPAAVATGGPAGSTATTTPAELVGGSPGGTTLPPAPTTPPSTVALPPFTVATIPAVRVPTSARPADKPIVVAVPYGVTDLNPHLVTQLPTDNAAVMSLVLPSPFRAGARGEAVLDQDLLAEAPKVVTTDPLLVQYVIRADASWSDGEPIGCDDFRLAALVGSGKYLQKLANGTTAPAFQTAVQAGYQHVSLGCQDAKHVTVSFDSTQTDWKWLFQSMMPAHVVLAAAKVSDMGAMDDAAAIRLAAAWNTGSSLAKELPKSAVSGGPFRVSNVSTNGVLLTINDKFWAVPALAKGGLLVKAIPVANQLEAMRTGAAQVLGLPADASKLDAIKAGSGVTLTKSAPVALTELVVNFGKPELQQRSLREAIRACIDRTSLLASRVTPVLPEAVAADNRMLSPTDAGYRPTDLPTAAGADRAKELLAKIGYTISTKTGVAEKAGRPLSLTLFYDPSGTLGQAVAEAAAAQCAPAGITLVPTPNSNEVVEGGPWDLALMTGSGELSLANLTARYTQNSPADIGRYASASTASLMKQAASALTEADLAETLNKLDGSIWADVASLPLYRAPALGVFTASVTGVSATPGTAGLFGSARVWH